MAIFRRRGGSQDVPEPVQQVDDVEPDTGDDDVEQPDRRVPALAADRSAGPWDVTERTDLEGYVDLGALRLPGVEGLEIRLDVEEQTGSVTAATVVLGGSVVQLQAFAAPRSEGIWDDIRSEISAGITQQGGTADEMPGSFGYELLAQIPARAADGRTVTQAARFAGIDGPRWFLRAVFHGPAAYDAAAAEPLEDLVRGVVVVRGGDAMAPRELLALRLPQGAPGTETAPAQDAEQPAEEAEARYPIDPFERGPEITEVR